MTLNGAMDSEAFGVYINRVLGPTLQTGDWVRLDNLSSPKPPAGCASHRIFWCPGAVSAVL